MRKIAYLECEMGHLGVREQRLVTKEDFPTPSPTFKNWLDWADPGEAFRTRDGHFLYICLQLTVEE